jgi:hypothetical protein
MDRTENKKILDFFMDDSPWYEKIIQKKKTIEKMPSIEKKHETIPSDEVIIKKEPCEEKVSIIEVQQESHNAIDFDKEFGEVDYAVLKAIAYGFKTISQISKALQIRTMVVEKHVYKLMKDGDLKYFQNCVLTSMGKSAIENFEKKNPDIWKPIDDYILSVIENEKERRVYFQKILDTALLISAIILILLIIYYSILS